MPSYPPREFERRLVTQSTMRTNAIVIIPPSFCHGLCFIERSRPLNDSMNALSVGFPGLLKSSFKPLEYAHRSKLLEMNSGPLSTRIVCGLPRCEATPSKTRTTSSPVNR